MNLNHRLDQIHALNLQFAAVEEKLFSEIASLKIQEEAVSAKLGAALQQAVQDTSEQSCLREEARQAVQALQALNQKLHALHEQHVQLQKELTTREQALLEQAKQAKQAKQELENTLRTQLQREQALNQQLEAEKHDRRKHEQTLLDKTSLARQETEKLLRTQAQREREVLAQMLAVQQQLFIQQDEFRHLHVAHSKREQALLEEHRQVRQQRNSLRDALVQREQEALTQLQAAQKQAAQEIAKLLREQSEQKHDLHRQHNEREETLTQQLQGLHQTLQLRAEQYRLELSTKVEERTRLLEACAALEAQLQTEMQTGQQTNMHLRQLLKEVQDSFVMTHTSLSWRITAPLRKLVSLFILNKNQTLAPISFSEPVKPELRMQVGTKLPPFTVNQALLEPLMPPLTQATSSNMPTIASTLAELLACHDQQFVICAYQTLLGRAPDFEGLGYYLDRLRTGFSKIQILAQIRLSNEGKTFAVNILGLDKAIRQHKQGQYPLIGWLFRQFSGNKENRPTDQKLRSIENQICMLSNESNLRFNQLEIALDSLHNLVVQQTQSIVVSLGISAKNNFNATPGTSNLPPEPDALRHLSPRARDVYFQLKTVAELYARRVN